MDSSAQLRGFPRLTRRRFLVLCATLFISSRFARNASAEMAKEYELKAAFLFHFAAFVEWPPTAFQSEDTPFIIGVLGEDSFGSALDNVVRSETRHDRPIHVARYQRGQTLRPCHILFICRSEGAYLPQTFREIQDRPILSVSDLDRFAWRGGIIGFDTGTGHVQLTINLKAARKANLAISSKLLRLAQVVEN